MCGSFAEAAVAASQLHHTTITADRLDSAGAWLHKHGAPISSLRIECLEAQSCRGAYAISKILPCPRLRSLEVANGHVTLASAPQQNPGPTPSEGVLAADSSLAHLALHNCLVAGWVAALPKLTNLQHLAVLPLPGASSNAQQHAGTVPAAAAAAAVDMGNSLTAMIPGSVLSHLTQLTQLQLSGGTGSTKDLSPAVSALTGLQVLSLSHLQDGSVLRQIQHLQNLDTLIIDGASLDIGDTTAGGLVQLSKLTCLALNSCQAVDPSLFSSNSSLTALQISSSTNPRCFLAHKVLTACWPGSRSFST